MYEYFDYASSCSVTVMKKHRGDDEINVNRVRERNRAVRGTVEKTTNDQQRFIVTIAEKLLIGSARLRFETQRPAASRHSKHYRTKITKVDRNNN